MASELSSDSLFDRLCRVLASEGFQWVVENIDTLISQRHLDDDSLRNARAIGDGNESDWERLDDGSGVRVLMSSEKLEILCEEIERCIIGPLEIANLLPKRLATEESPNGVAIHIADIGDSREFVVSTTREICVSEVASLKKLVASVRGRI